MKCSHVLVGALALALVHALPHSTSEIDADAIVPEEFIAKAKAPPPNGGLPQPSGQTPEVHKIVQEWLKQVEDSVHTNGDNSDAYLSDAIVIDAAVFGKPVFGKGPPARAKVPTMHTAMLKSFRDATDENVIHAVVAVSGILPEPSGFCEFVELRKGSDGSWKAALQVGPYLGAPCSPPKPKEGGASVAPTDGEAALLAEPDHASMDWTVTQEAVTEAQKLLTEWVKLDYEYAAEDKEEKKSKLIPLEAFTADNALLGTANPVMFTGNKKDADAWYKGMEDLSMTATAAIQVGDEVHTVYNGRFTCKMHAPPTSMSACAASAGSPVMSCNLESKACMWTGYYKFKAGKIQYDVYGMPTLDLKVASMATVDKVNPNFGDAEFKGKFK